MRKSTLFIALFALFLILPVGVSAYQVHKGQSIIIGKDEIINDNLYIAAANITIEGRVRGDVFCAGQNIVIKGPVEGSVFCAGQSIVVDGPVSGSVRVAGSAININNVVGQNVNAFGATVNLSDASKVGWDVLIGTASANLNGEINKDLHGGGAAITINGKVGKNVNLSLGDKNSQLTLGDRANIGGNLSYQAEKDASISDKAKIAGKTERKEFKRSDWQGPKLGKIIFWGLIYSILASILVGLVLIGLFKRPIITTTEHMLKSIWASIGLGFAAVVLGPIALILLALTLVGIPLALLLLGVWIIAIGISKIVAGIFVGRVLVQKYWSAKKDSLVWQMIIGIIILSLIAIIPFIGWLAALIIMFWALGGMLIAAKKA